MRTSLQRIGNSQGVIIPKPLLAQTGLVDDVEMVIENNAIVLRRPKVKVREGWAIDSKAIADAAGDALVWPEFSNADDAELTW